MHSIQCFGLTNYLCTSSSSSPFSMFYSYVYLPALHNARILCVQFRFIDVPYNASILARPLRVLVPATTSSSEQINATGATTSSSEQHRHQCQCQHQPTHTRTRTPSPTLACTPRTVPARVRLLVVSLSMFFFPNDYVFSGAMLKRTSFRLNMSSL
jgi:hypothetical protein